MLSVLQTAFEIIFAVAFVFLLYLAFGMIKKKFFTEKRKDNEDRTVKRIKRKTRIKKS